ncbi:MAG: hypothetical protein V1684_02695 [bacterium]
MLIFLLTIIFGLVLFFSGWQISRWAFRENRAEVLLPLGGLFGIAPYLFLLNLSSYFIDIEINFYLVLLFLFLIGGWLFVYNKKDKLEWGINKKEAILIFASTLVIMILVGLSVSRTLTGDELSQFHLTSAASIAGGNFPVKEINIPSNLQAYHYGANLLFAALAKVTGLPIWSAFYLTAFLFSGVIFLLLFLLARLIIKENISAFWVALVAMLAGGLRFVYLIPGLVTLFKRFVLHQNIAHPFEFFAWVWTAGPALTNSLPELLADIWAPLGWALFLGIIFIHQQYFLSDDRQMRFFSGLALVVFLSVLALAIETSVLILALAFLFFPLFGRFLGWQKSQSKRLWLASALVLLVAGCLILVQGGTMTTILYNFYIGQPSMGEPINIFFFNHPWAFLNNGQLVSFYSRGFVLNFGLIYFLIIPASIFLIKRRLRAGLLLIMASFLSFIIPFFISFNPFWQDTVNRLFCSVNFIWGLLTAVFLLLIIKDYLSKSRFIKYLIVFILAVVCLDGFVSLLTRPLYAPRLATINSHGFFAGLRPASPAEAKAYDWVKNNTAIDDYFLAFDNIEEVGTDFPIAQNYRFVFYAQRLAPIYSEGHNYLATPNPEYPLAVKYQEVIRTCNPDILKELKYRYLFIDNNWPASLAEQCLTNNHLELKFESRVSGESIKIYRVAY